MGTGESNGCRRTKRGDGFEGWCVTTNCSHRRRREEGAEGDGHGFAVSFMFSPSLPVYINFDCGSGQFARCFCLRSHLFSGILT